MGGGVVVHANHCAAHVPLPNSVRRRELGCDLTTSRVTVYMGSMADSNDKVKDNVTGRFFVDSQCIDCNLCRETAPKNFKQNEDAGYSYVFKQPENDEELGQCKEAKEACPVEAIGDVGEGATDPVATAPIQPVTSGS